MKKLLFIAPLIVLIAAACNSGTNNTNLPTSSQQTTPPASSSSSSNSTTNNPTSPTGTLKKIVITGMNYGFNPKTITVNKGDKVQLTFEDTSGAHDLVIPAFNATTPILQAGQSAIISFTASKTGNFQYYSSVGGDQKVGMVGTLMVK